MIHQKAPRADNAGQEQLTDLLSLRLTSKQQKNTPTAC
jgi:hypothetical protein